MATKFEDLVQALNNAKSEFDLSRVPFQAIKEGSTDLLNRLRALEKALQAPPA